VLLICISATSFVFMGKKQFWNFPNLTNYFSFVPYHPCADYKHL